MLITTTEGNTQEIETFVCHAMTLCDKLVTFGLEITPVLKVIAVVTLDKELSDTVLNLWSNLLMHCPVHELNALLELGKKGMVNYRCQTWEHLTIRQHVLEHPTIANASYGTQKVF